MVVESKFRMAEMENARVGLMALKDEYDLAKAECAELRELSKELDVDTVRKLALLLKEKTELYEAEKRFNKDEQERREHVLGQLRDEERKNADLRKEKAEVEVEKAEVEKTLQIARKEYEKEATERQKVSSVLEKTQEDNEAAAKSWEAERLRLEARMADLEAEKLKMAAENEELKSRQGKADAGTSSGGISKEALDAYVRGFGSCQRQITRKFPGHGLDFSKLDILEESEEEESEEGDEEEGEEESESGSEE